MNATPKKPVIVLGPQGIGKTRHADALMQAFGATTLVDDWYGEPLQSGTLALGNDCDAPAAPPGCDLFIVPDEVALLALIERQAGGKA